MVRWNLNWFRFVCIAAVNLCKCGCHSRPFYLLSSFLAHPARQSSESSDTEVVTSSYCRATDASGSYCTFKIDITQASFIHRGVSGSCVRTAFASCAGNRQHWNKTCARKTWVLDVPPRVLFKPDAGFVLNYLFTTTFYKCKVLEKLYVWIYSPWVLGESISSQGNTVSSLNGCFWHKSQSQGALTQILTVTSGKTFSLI